MAEAGDDQEKTEEATPRRREQAREKGQVARSKELGTAAILVAAAITMIAVGESLAKALLEVARGQFSLNRLEAIGAPALRPLFFELLATLAWPLLGFIVSLFIAGFIGNIAMGGMSFSLEAAAPKLNKMSPIKGFGRMFGIQAIVELLKSIAKFLVIAGCAFTLLWVNFDQILGLSHGNPDGSIRDSVELLLGLFVLLCCSLILIVMIDAPYQLWNHNKQLRMSKQEVKDEYKQTEGKPEVKGRIRQLQREMAQRRMMSEVPTADVVIVNPTHYSVALKYDREKSPAPIVVAKGNDEIALKIREIAREYEVPILSSPMLARALSHSTKLDQPIPEGLFSAVAQVLAYVFQMQQYRRGQGRQPTPLPSELPVPEELQIPPGQ